MLPWDVLFFLFAVMLFPRDVAVDQDYVQVFERNRGWFLCLFALTSIADLMLTALRGDLLDPPFYLPLALHFSMLGVHRCLGEFSTLSCDPRRLRRGRRTHLVARGAPLPGVVSGCYHAGKEEIVDHSRMASHDDPG